MSRKALLPPGLLLALALALALAIPGSGQDDPQPALLPVRRGDLEVVLRLEGNLAPFKDRSIKSPNWGSIRSMAPNGSRVKRGQVVLELDSERLEERLRDHAADVAVRGAELQQAQQEAEKSRRRAVLQHEAAKLNHALERAKYRELKARPTDREMIDARSSVHLARELVKSSAEACKLVGELVESGYAPGEELRTAELDLVKARADLAGAMANLESVSAGASITEMQEAAFRVNQAQLSERTSRKNIARIKEMTDTRLDRVQRLLEREKQKLKQVQRQVHQYRVVAPSDGVVLYAKHRWGGTWQPGQHVWQGATIMSIPNISRMKMIVQIPADWVRKMNVRDRPAARVSVEAIPGKTFKARLTRISTVGRDEFEQLDPSTAGKLGRAERQVFEAEIELTDKDPRLKPGFGAEAEIIVRRLKGVLILPRLALIEDRARDARRRRERKGKPGHRGKPGRKLKPGGARQSAPAPASIYVATPAGFEIRRVEVLATNRFEAAVKGRLEPGDRLYPGRPPPGNMAPSPSPGTPPVPPGGAR